jgi:hypothetical protein
MADDRQNLACRERLFEQARVVFRAHNLDACRARVDRPFTNERFHGLVCQMRSCESFLNLQDLVSSSL